MRCRNCEYLLWNLRSRNCPECGQPFAIEDFTFAPNTVEFHCPHCNQEYFGTDDSGRLVPRAFACARCKQPITMEQMVLRPVDGFENYAMKRDLQPWLDRKRVGAFKAFWMTIGMALTSPIELMQQTPPHRPIWPAITFAARAALPVVLLGYSFVFIFPIFMFTMATGPGGTPAATAILLAILYSILIVIGCVLVLLLSSLIWAGVAHLLLHATGCVPYPFQRTWQALLYGSGANIFSAIPCLGPYLGWIYWVVIAIFTTKEAQKVSTGRAVGAVLALPGLVLTGCLGLWFVTVFLS